MGEHSEIEGKYITSNNMNEILDYIFDDGYENYPEELISYNWQEENTEKFDEIIKLNEDIYEKCSIPIVKTYNISDEFK